MRIVGRGASLDRGTATGRDRGRQRLRYQLGLRLKTPRPRVIAGGAADRSTRQDRAVSRLMSSRKAPAGRDHAARWVVRAEAGGSPSSEAPPGSLVAPAMSALVEPGFGLARGAAHEESRKADRGRTRESIDPKGARVVGRLQTSGRRIFSVPQTGRRKASRRGRGSLKRPPLPLTWLDRIAASERVRGWACKLKSARALVHLGRKVEGNPVEGALVRVMPSF